MARFYNRPHERSHRHPHAHRPRELSSYRGKARTCPGRRWPARACKHVISGKLYRTVSDGSWSVPRRIEQMSEMRVTRQVLSPMPELLSYWLPLDDAKVLIRYLNEQIAEMLQAAPSASSAWAACSGHGQRDQGTGIPEEGFEFPGVEIASHVNGVSIGDARFEPFFAAAERLGAAIFVHALRPAGQERIVGAFPEQAVCFPGDVALACASMITGGIASRHPKLRIAFSHGGGTMPILMPRLVHAWNNFPKAKESLRNPPRRSRGASTTTSSCSSRTRSASWWRLSAKRRSSSVPTTPSLGDWKPIETLKRRPRRRDAYRHHFC